MEKFTSYRFVKSEDLNHHGTLFAGRAAEWFIETGLMTVSKLIPADGIVCVNVHEMKYREPIKLGSLIEASGRPVLIGRSSLMVYIEFRVGDKLIVSGYISYVYIDGNGKAQPHGLSLGEQSEEELKLAKRAKMLQDAYRTE